MKKIKNWFSNYIRKNTKLKIFGDVVFYVLIILMIIPVTRRDLSALLIRATLRKPHVETGKSLKGLSGADYQLSLADMNGNDLMLGDFKNKVVLLNFWATWCPPCRAELPAMQDLYDDYGDRISFVLVSSEDAGKLKNFLDESGYTLPVYTQQSPLPAAFRVSSIPTTFLISRQGEIVVDKNGAADWNSKGFREQLDKLIRK